MLETSMHKQNMFITLTYDNNHIPADGSIDKRELQLFFKRLRKKINPIKIKYLACGEYGEKFGRPHYHACVCGVDLRAMDGELFGPGRSGSSRFRQLAKPVLSEGFGGRAGESPRPPDKNYILSTSKVLDSLWGNGFASIGDLTFDSAAYVARYCLKKITGENEENHYKGKEKEFALMSRRPGIGFEWFLMYSDDIIRANKLIVNKDLQLSVPRYYNNIIQSVDKKTMNKMKLERRLKINKEDNTWERLLTRERVQKHNQLQIKREYENNG